MVSFPLEENEKVLAVISQAVDAQHIWIPLPYISPRLEGALVRRKVGTGIQNIYVTLGDIDDSSVQVLS